MLCQCPKLTPLQSRLLASVTALALLGLLYWSLSNPHFAYAAELEIDGSGLLRSGEDHNWHRIQEERLQEDGIDLDDDGVEGKAVEDGMLEMRQAQVEAKDISGNNVGNLDNIEPGNNTVWRFSRSLLNGNHTDSGPGLPANVTASSGDAIEHVELRKRSTDD